MDIGKRIRQLRIKNDLTLEELDRSLLKDYADKIFNGAIKE